MSAMRASVRQAGFSLLEVLVAFVIMALSLGALYQAIGGNVRGIAQADRLMRAALLAEGLLARHRAIPAGGLDESGQSDDGLRWSYRAEPYLLPQPSPQGWPLYQVRVSIEWPATGAGGDGRFELYSLLPERRQREVQ